MRLPRPKTRKNRVCTRLARRLLEKYETENELYQISKSEYNHCIK